MYWNCDCNAHGDCDCRKEGVGMSGVGLFTIPEEEPVTDRPWWQEVIQGGVEIGRDVLRATLPTYRLPTYTPPYSGYPEVSTYSGAPISRTDYTLPLLAVGALIFLMSRR